MKKILSILLITLGFASIQSCKKTSFVSDFSKSPEARMADSINFVKQTLTSAPNGWIVTTPVFFGGGYGFYMDFNDSLNVTMYSDLLDDFASTPYTSQTRVREDLGVALTFDTYNYISELNDPGNNIRNGYGGDVDYIYDHTGGDSIIFLGKRYRMPLSFVKATAAQASTYNSGGYLTAIQGFRNFFTTNANPYITLDDGTKISIVPNFSNDLNAGKRISLTALDAQNNISIATAKFAMTVDQMAVLDSGVNVSGLRFIKLAWKDAQTLAIYTSTGKEYIINNSPAPILPLYMLMGVKYASLFSPYPYPTGGLPGTSSAGYDIAKFYYNLTSVPISSTSVATFNYGTITLTWDIANSRVKFNGYVSQKGGPDGWTTTITYTYTVDADGVYTFTLLTPATGGYISARMTQLDNFLQTNRIALDYYIDGSNVYGKMSSVDNPSIVITFQLQ